MQDYKIINGIRGRNFKRYLLQPLKTRSISNSHLLVRSSSKLIMCDNPGFEETNNNDNESHCIKVVIRTPTDFTVNSSYNDWSFQENSINSRKHTSKSFDKACPSIGSVRKNKIISVYSQKFLLKKNEIKLPPIEHAFSMHGKRNSKNPLKANVVNMQELFTTTVLHKQKRVPRFNELLF
ncbi:unnamed protein product [Blepharisma stoltei]|uniref:Uncharacterized protein n=1 Tax=Blepharisma stoltei TaxID=1481888 RepID=A0AAU9J2F5_9CILI|nr:unnamed protein product [Blepharisma stoltei]